MTIHRSFAIASACAFLALQSVPAQELDPGRSKLLGEAMQGHQHATYQRLGQQRAQIVYYTVQSEDPIPVVETQQMVMAIKKDLAASDAALARLKAKHPKEEDVLKQIASIEQHHAKAHQDCDAAERALKSHVDQAAVSQSCSDMWHELDAAQVDTQKLLKMLKIEKLEPPKKVVAAVPAATK